MRIFKIDPACTTLVLYSTVLYSKQKKHFLALFNCMGHTKWCTYCHIVYCSIHPPQTELHTASRALWGDRSAEQPAWRLNSLSAHPRLPSVAIPVDTALHDITNSNSNTKKTPPTVRTLP